MRRLLRTLGLLKKEWKETGAPDWHDSDLWAMRGESMKQTALLAWTLIVVILSLAVGVATLVIVLVK